MIYVASPYSDLFPEVRQARFEQVRDFCWKLMQEGQVVFSPIVYGHQFAILSGEEKVVGLSFWKTFDEFMMDKATALLVYKMPGWDTSHGVMHEIEWAIKNNKPIVYVETYETWQSITQKH